LLNQHETLDAYYFIFSMQKKNLCLV